MGLADEIAQEQRLRGPHRGNRCTVDAYLEQLDDDERGEVEAALAADPLLVTTSAIAAVLERRGCDLTPETLRRHRSGRCRCRR